MELNPPEKVRKVRAEVIFERLQSGLVKTTKQSLEILCLNASLTSSTMELASPESNCDPQTSTDRGRIDQELMTSLTRRRLINWTEKTCTLAPLRMENIASSVNGLLRAVACAIWGMEDEATESFLQRLIHVTLTSGRENSMFQERWRLEQENSSPDHQHHTKVTWEDVCYAFKDTRALDLERVKVDDHLHAIHLFSLSNILRRPVLVVGDVSSCYDDRTTDLTGLYLPLLSSPESCVPYPVVLVRHERAFHPLLVKSDPLAACQMMPFRSVPILRIDQEPFYIRCLLTSESVRVQHLIMSYLKIAEISCELPEATVQVLTARLSSGKAFPVPVGSGVGLSKESSKASSCCSPPVQTKHVTKGRLDSDDVENEDWTVCDQRHERSSSQCAACRTDHQGSDSNQLTTSGHSKNGQIWPPDCSKETQCRNVPCRNKASASYGDRCYACYVRGDDMAEFRDLRISDLDKVKDILDSPKAGKSQKPALHPIHDATKQDVGDKNPLEDNVVPCHIRSKTKDASHVIQFMNINESPKIRDIKDIEAVRVVSKLPSATQNRVVDREVLATCEENSSELGKTSSSSAAGKIPRNSFSERFKVDDVVTRNSDIEARLQALDPRKDFDFKDVEAMEQTCIVDFCDKRGESTYRGLCGECYGVLAQHRIRKSKDQSTSGVRCLTEGCKEVIVNQQLGLCLSCLRLQIFAARDLERKRIRGKALSQSSVPHQTTQTKYPASPTNPPEHQYPSFPKRRVLKSSNDVFEEAEVTHHLKRGSRKSFLDSSSSQRSRARFCLNSDCDRYGDPSFHGMCSLCFEKLKMLSPRS